MTGPAVHEPDDLLKPGEVGRIFRVDAKTVNRWAKNGRLTSVLTLGGHRRYIAAEVYALRDERTVPLVPAGGYDPNDDDNFNESGDGQNV